jgi:anti-sigma factor RsiW
MTPRGRPVKEDDLHARIDGQLPRERFEEVDAYLAAHPEEQTRFSQYAQQRQALRAAFAAQADSPIPMGLRVAHLLEQQRRRRLRPTRSDRRGGVPDCLGRRRRLGCARPCGPGKLVAARGGRTHDHRRCDRRASDILGRGPPPGRGRCQPGDPSRAMALQAAGPTTRRTRSCRRRVPPDGGRLLPGEDGPAAQFLYENGNGERLTLYLRAGVGGETAFRFHEEGSIGAFYWSDEGFGYAIAAKADRNLLLRIAEIIYRQTTPDGARAKLPPAPGKPS